MKFSLKATLPLPKILQSKILEKKWHFWRNFWLFWLKNGIFSEHFWDLSGLSQIWNKIFENFLTPTLPPRFLAMLIYGHIAFLFFEWPPFHTLYNLFQFRTTCLKRSTRTKFVKIFKIKLKKFLETKNDAKLRTLWLNARFRSAEKIRRGSRWRKSKFQPTLLSWYLVTEEPASVKVLTDYLAVKGRWCSCRRVVNVKIVAVLNGREAGSIWKNHLFIILLK